MDMYASPQIQNKVLKFMAMSLSRLIAETVRSCKFFALIADEVADVSNKEQVVVCLRYVDSYFVAHEELVGIHQVASIWSNVLVSCLRDILLRMNLPFSCCRGQCYDGASNMAGVRNGWQHSFLRTSLQSVQK